MPIDNGFSIRSQPGAQRCGKYSARLEVTDKIGLPLSYANGIYQRAELGAELATWRGSESKSMASSSCPQALFDGDIY